MSGSGRGQQRTFDSLELELHVGAGNRTWVLCRSSKCSEPLSHLHRSHIHILNDILTLLVLGLKSKTLAIIFFL